MSSSPAIPRGNTQRNVNATIINLLKAIKVRSILDFPCGRGEFISAFANIFKPELACAADLVPGIPGDPVQVYVRDATEPFDFSRQAPDGFDVITCISGVMVFEGLGTFLKNCRNNLANDGVLVLTNDNSITIRDRLSFLLSGRVRRYRLFMEAGEECWNYISLGALLIKLEENGFRLERIKYVSVFPEDWIWFPLIPVVYFLQLAVLFRPGRYSLTERLALIPPAALICRHYILVCSKLPAGEFTR